MNPLKFIIILLFSLFTYSADTTRVLWIGNSYTSMTFDMPSLTGNMAAQKSIPYFKQSSIKGGRGWYYHWNEDTVALHLIKSGNWDYVILQDGSSGALASNFANFVYYGKLFTNEVYKAGAKPILYMTWAYEDRVPKYDSANNRWLPSMYDTIRDNYYRLADTTGAYVAPIGIVHAEIWKEHKVDLWADGTHPNAAGANISAGTHFATLFGESLQGINIIKYGTTDIPDSSLVKAIHNKIDSVIKRPSVKRYLPPWNRPSVSSTQFIGSEYSVERLNKMVVTLSTTFSDGTKDTASNKFVFRMLDTSVATIDYTGMITGVSPGVTQLIARRKSASDTITVRVNEITAALDSIRLSFNRYSILASDTFPLNAAGYFTKGGNRFSTYINKLVTWSCSDTSLAEVKNGVVIPKGKRGSIIIMASYSGKSDTCRISLGPKLQYALRINFQASAEEYNFGWKIDNVGQGYSGDNILGWQNHSSMFSYDDRLGNNYLLKTFTMPYAYGNRNYRIKAPTGNYIIKIAMGDNKNGTGTNTIFTAFGTDTLISYIGTGNFIKKDTISVTATTGGTFDLVVKGQICYLVLISNEGVDIDSVAWDDGVRLSPFTIQENPPITSVRSINEHPSQQLSCVAYPNPFNPVTTIKLSGLKAGRKSELTIHDISGRLVADLSSHISNNVEWNASHLPSGIYIVNFRQNAREYRSRVTLLK
ncbi:MAG: T9SS type A sorting domain-containing protein [Fibrobacteres bacterium]|nr:T9SS type A sorting domain-containing protein [Fibrobacterota bacterium]